MSELLKILGYRLVWLNLLLSILFTVLAFITYEFAALSFLFLGNFFDILGYHFTLIRQIPKMPDKIFIKSYRVNQFMFDLLLFLLLGSNFDWIASLSGWILKEFGAQDILYYFFLKKELPANWTWMKWTPLGFIKGDLTKNEIVVQALTGILIAAVLLILR